MLVFVFVFVFVFVYVYVCVCVCALFPCMTNARICVCVVFVYVSSPPPPRHSGVRLQQYFLPSEVLVGSSGAGHEQRQSPIQLQPAFLHQQHVPVPGKNYGGLQQADQARGGRLLPPPFPVLMVVALLWWRGLMLGVCCVNHCAKIQF